MEAAEVGWEGRPWWMGAEVRVEAPRHPTSLPPGVDRWGDFLNHPLRHGWYRGRTAMVGMETDYCSERRRSSAAVAVVAAAEQSSRMELLMVALVVSMWVWEAVSGQEGWKDLLEIFASDDEGMSGTELSGRHLPELRSCADGSPRRIPLIHCPRNVPRKDHWRRRDDPMLHSLPPLHLDCGHEASICPLRRVLPTRPPQAEGFVALMKRDKKKRVKQERGK